MSVDGEETSEWGVDYLTVYHRGRNLIEMLKEYMIQRGNGKLPLEKTAEICVWLKKTYIPVGEEGTSEWGVR